MADKVRGRAQIICAIGAEHAGQVKQLAQAAVDCGAIALLFPPPGFLPYAQDDLVDFVAEVAADLPLPVLIYHIPQCTRDLGLENILRLIATVPNVIGLKDSSGHKPNLSRIHAAQAQGPMVFMIGSDDLLLDAFELGAVGSISGIAGACPELILPVYQAMQAGDKAAARALQDRLDEFIRHISELPSPWAMKLALQVQGLDVGTLAWPMGSKFLQKAQRFQEWFGLQVDGAGHLALGPLKAPAGSA
jgi:4-hydroxy-tetrahydrodipicolinate synthase